MHHKKIRHLETHTKDKVKCIMSAQADRYIFACLQLCNLHVKKPGNLNDYIHVKTNIKPSHAKPNLLFINKLWSGSCPVEHIGRLISMIEFQLQCNYISWLSCILVHISTYICTSLNKITFLSMHNFPSLSS